MTTPSQPGAGPTDNPTALAAEWILLNSGCENLMSYDEWNDRRTAAVAYADTWSEPERTEFWYAVADQACTEALLAPTTGLSMTPENLAREDRRLNRIVSELDDGQGEFAPYNWLRFTEPAMYGFTVGEIMRYGRERAGLAYGRDPRPSLSAKFAELADVKLADFFPEEPQA